MIINVERLVMEMNKEKTEYIINSLTKGTHKRYETYVINAIYQQLNNLELEIVTQKYVRNKEDNKYYLIDLYLPQFKLGIEIDEGQHKKEIAEDEYRQKRIIYLSEVEEIKRIPDKNNLLNLKKTINELTLDEINHEIDNICCYIKDRENYKSIRWLYGSELIEEYKKIGKIPIGAEFRTNLDVIDLVYGKKYKKYQRGIYKPKDGIPLWFPILDEYYDNEDELKKNNKWKNSISNDLNYIYEYPNNLKIEAKKEEAIKNKNKEKRYVFLKERDSFGKAIKRFIGLYKSLGWDDNKQCERWMRENNEELPIYKS